METVTIARYEDGDLPAASAFVRSWTSDERYARFWSPGESAAAWLIDRLASASHRAFIAREGDEYVGLLDCVVTPNEIDFGVFVRGERRRRTIGTRLVRTLIALGASERRIVAQCRIDNAAAVALLRACRFASTSARGGEIGWEYR
jgi:RimJ/RimL family protein N-acetyltransferase